MSDYKILNVEALKNQSFDNYTSIVKIFQKFQLNQENPCISCNVLPRI